MPAEFGTGPAGAQGDPGPEGPSGPAGTELIIGHGAPPTGIYASGTTYLDEDTGDLYRFV